VLGFIYHNDFLKHDTGKDHPEHPSRLQSIYDNVFNSDLIKTNRVKAVKAEFNYDINNITQIHSPGYIEELKNECESGSSYFQNKENRIDATTFDTAVKSAFSGLYAADLLIDGDFKQLFIASRPPGHHADLSRAYGFCFFNNIAIAAKYLLDSKIFQRIMIIDIDVHHGNGTQNIFYDSKDVFYYSIHEHPTFLFPGTGRFFDTGKKNGKGFTLNSPMKPESEDDDYFKELLNKFYPAVCEFKPEIILVSAGYDGHKNDIMGDICLSTNGFRRIFYALKYLAAEYCEDRIMIFLEGGYEPEVLSRCILNTLDGMTDGYNTSIFDALATADMFGFF